MAVKYLKSMAKAIVAGLISFGSSLGAAAGAGSISTQAWILAAVSGLTALAAVYGVRNVPLDDNA